MKYFILLALLLVGCGETSVTTTKHMKFALDSCEIHDGLNSIVKSHGYWNGARGFYIYEVVAKCNDEMVVSTEWGQAESIN